MILQMFNQIDEAENSQRINASTIYKFIISSHTSQKMISEKKESSASLNDIKNPYSRSSNFSIIMTSFPSFGIATPKCRFFGLWLFSAVFDTSSH